MKHSVREQSFPEDKPKDIAREVTTLEKQYSDVIKNIGKFVLIQGSSVVAYFDSYSDAIAEGYKQFGLNSFLVRPAKNDIPIRAMRCGLSRMGNTLRLAKRAKA